MALLYHWWQQLVADDGSSLYAVAILEVDVVVFYRLLSIVFRF
jgi:hypothetical protein